VLETVGEKLRSIVPRIYTSNRGTALIIIGTEDTNARGCIAFFFSADVPLFFVNSFTIAQNIFDILFFPPSSNITKAAIFYFSFFLFFSSYSSQLLRAFQNIRSVYNSYL
jgi:hypothetical protein